MQSLHRSGQHAAPKYQITPSWPRPSAPRALWCCLVLFAALDVMHPIPELTGSWWGIFIVLWLVPRLPPVANVKGCTFIAICLSTLILFSWLVERTEAAVLESINTWQVFQGTPLLRLLAYPIHATIAAAVTAALTVVPMRRVVGKRATIAMAVLASLPFALHLARYVFIPSAKPLVIPIRIYAAVIPVLIIAETASLLTRFQVDGERFPAYQWIRTIAGKMMAGQIGVGTTWLTFFSTMAGTVWVIRWWSAECDAQDHFIGALAVYLAAFAAITAASAMAAIGAWRSVARSPGDTPVLGSIAMSGRLFVVASMGVALIAYTLIMPRIGYSLSMALQLLPGPAWSIADGSAPDTLRLSGEFRHGVSNALAHALARRSIIRRLELDSPGGSVEEGLAIAALVDKYTLSTIVQHACLSACTLVFLSGREREMATGARLGFHRAQGLFWDNIRYDDDRCCVFRRR